MRDEAGVSTGAIYTYFPNKEALLRAILERARDDRRRLLAAAESGVGGSADPAVVLLEWATAVFSAQGKHAARIDVNLWAEALRSPGVRRLAQGALRDATDAVSAVVAARLPASGATSSLDPGAVASVLVAFFLGLEVQTAVGLGLEPSEIVRVLGTLFADYLPDAHEPGQRPVERRSRRRAERRP